MKNNKNKRQKSKKISLLKQLSTGLLKTLPTMLMMVAIVSGVYYLKDVEVPTVLPLNNIEVSGELAYLDVAGTTAALPIGWATKIQPARRLRMPMNSRQPQAVLSTNMLTILKMPLIIQ